MYLVAMFYFGETPCSDQPFMQDTVTDEDGYFVFETLPAGFYYMTLHKPDGGWIRLNNWSGLSIGMIPVYSGEVKDLTVSDIGE